ncbi:AMP-binding protein [Rhodopseudomonas sp.]|uniref:AMP-binding protein n=1 Tax=Rhodopseudomonas sp. TaxID=1078 RepID=UPI003B3A6E27
MNSSPLRESYWAADRSRPVLDVAIGDVLGEVAAQERDRLALVEVVPSGMGSPVGAASTDRTWTYAELADDARRCASWLLTQFRTGDHICVWAPNLPEWVVLQYGAALSGLVLVTANPALKASELEFVLQQS